MNAQTTATQALIDALLVRLKATKDQATRCALQAQLSALYDERNKARG